MNTEKAVKAIKMRRGFSLVELLVVVAIIALLTAILLPVFQTVRANARKATCLSNERQIGIAIFSYAQDYSEGLPFAPDSAHKVWITNGNEVYGDPLDALILRLADLPQTLQPYCKSTDLFHCPADFGLPPAFRQPGDKDSDFEQYGSSYFYDDERALKGYSLASYVEPSQNIMLGDSFFWHGGTTGADGLANELFADGHSKTLTWSVRSRILDDQRTQIDP